MFGGKPTKAEEEYMNSLKSRMTSDVYSKDQLNMDIITGTRGAMGQFNDQVNQGIGVMESQGLGDSVLATQVGLKERANIADGLNTTAIDATATANNINIQAKRDAEMDFYDLKSKLAQRRQDVSQGGFENLVGGATDVIAYNQEAKYVNGLGMDNSNQAIAGTSNLSFPTYEQSVRKTATGRSSLKPTNQYNPTPKKKPLPKSYGMLNSTTGRGSFGSKRGTTRTGRSSLKRSQY